MPKKINVSFKENDRDMKLYAYIANESDKSYIIKKALELYLKYIEKHNEPEKRQ